MERLLSQKTEEITQKRALIIPKDRRDYTEIAENYRPISITGALSKFFEELLYKQINEYF